MATKINWIDIEQKYVTVTLCIQYTAATSSAAEVQIFSWADQSRGTTHHAIRHSTLEPCAPRQVLISETSIEYS